MSTQVKGLIIAAIALTMLFMIGHWFGFRSEGREPRTHVMRLDTAAVVSIHLEDRRSPMNDVHLNRDNMGGWTRTTSSVQALGPEAQAREMLTRFHHVEVKRTMGMIRLLAERYHLTEDELFRITFIGHDGGIDALNIGSDTFAPGEVGAWTYVNVPGEREVYAVEGLLLLGIRAMEDTL